MKSKHLLSALLAAALCLSMAACGEEETTDTDTADAAVDTSPVELEQPTHISSWSDKLESVAVSPETDFTFTVGANGVTLTAYHGDAAEVRVPDTVNGLPVIKLGDEVFRDNTALKILILPDSVTVFGENVLAGCTSLEALSTPLDAMEDNAHLGYLFGADTFENNSRDVPATLKFLRIGGTPETLPAYALYDCNDLVAIELPESLTAIERFALAKCDSLEELALPAGLTSIGEYAFSTCMSLSTLTLGKTVKTVGFAALYECRNLCELTLPFVGETEEKNSYLGYLFGAEYPDHAKGLYPTQLARVNVTNAKTLGSYAFFECATLKEVTLPECLETVGVRAFYGCTKLWSIELPDSVTTIREAAFTGCDSLISVDFGKSLTSVGINAFYGCDSLTSIKLPESLESLPASAFADCKSLETVDLGGVTEVGAQAFRNCSAVREVKAKDGITFGDGNHTVSDHLN